LCYLIDCRIGEGLTDRIVNATIDVYKTITSQLLPTPTKSHYTFNLRDLSKVFQGMTMCPINKTKDIASLLRLWYHECCRVFQDRLVNNEDRTWFTDLVKNRIPAFGVQTGDVLTSNQLFYGDFMVPGADSKVYCEIEDHTKLVRQCEEYLEDYNATSTAQMKLVLFLDAIQHVTRISRVIRQPLGNSLLLGVGGSGRQSLTRLAAHMAEYDCFQIELSKNYGMTEWRDDLRRVMMKAGLEDKQVVFLFSDTQIKSESFLEDINNILNSGDVPNIYGFDDLESIYNAMKPVVQDAGQQPTKGNLYSAYNKRVRSNIHVVICMSPIGEVFRARLRQFPSLVNCCTIDWFSEWPDEALQSVASTFLQEITDLDEGTPLEGLVSMCVDIHQSVSNMSKRYLAELSRHNYVTPTSYLELLGTFQKLIKLKKTEISQMRSRTKIGLDKLLSTAEEVSKLREELETMRPMLEQAQVETEQTMEQIQKDSVIANETKEKVQVEEAAATTKAEETKTIADDAQRDLDEALPALDAAVASLKSLNKSDVVEVRALMRPPPGVRLVIEAVSIMKEVKPKKVAGEKMGTKVDDYWEPGKALLQDPTKFLEGLFKYDKENIPDQVIQKIQPYIDNDDFQPAAIAKVSKACTSICQWVRAMHKYHFVAKGVAPKRQRLAEAQASLNSTLAILNEAKARLREVEEGIATLQQKYEECMAKKQDLAEKCELCSARLGRAEKLIGGLADEKVRWAESVSLFDAQLKNIVGDVLVAAGSVAYLAPFTGEFRNELISSWINKLTSYQVQHDAHSSLVRTLGDPVKIRQWQIAGLPRDTLSVENGVMVHFSRRWPLFIDPQGQANKWIKSLEKDNGLDVVKLTDRDFLRSLENAVRFGKPCLLENVGEELDPALEPILLKQTFKQAGSTVIKLGDTTIPYHDDFKLYITTKLPNPHYTPEVSAKVTLVNFTLSPSGLEDQLLALVVAEERPDLEEAKNQLIVSNARMRQELKEIEDKILEKLSVSEGSPVDDSDLIDTLQKSKVKSEEIKAKVMVAEQTEKDIDTTRSLYIPVAVRTQILFFCVTDLANIDPMYQYSLEWFISIFLGSIANAEASDVVEQRIVNINDYFTFSLYSNVCRSLFEKHKLLFSFLLCVRILTNDNQIDMDEYRHLIAGGTSALKTLPNPSPDWLSNRSWSEILTLPCLSSFTTFAEDFGTDLDGFKRIFDSEEPHREPLPGKWNEALNHFQRLLVLRCLRADKVTNAMQDFVSEKLGQRFIEPQTADLSLAYKDSSPTCPLIFVLSVGTDPAADLYKFAEEMKFSKKLSAISLGQGQGPRAEQMMKSAMERGKWVFFQNCHLAPSWMPSLERLIEQIDGDKVHRDFRLWLTSMPSPKFPVSILQNGSKMTVEPPRGIKANLLQSFSNFNNDFLNSCSKPNVFRSLLFSLCLFHGVTIERRKFGALGFNIPYEFTIGDLRICISQLKMFLDEYSDVPYKVLKYTAGHINIGGRVTDDWDRRCIMNVLEDYYNPNVLNDGHSYSESGIFYQLAGDSDHAAYMQYIKGLPINDTPEIFCLHSNANITFAQNETFALLDGLVRLQPKTSGGSGTSMEEAVDETCKGILERIPSPVALDLVMKKYPVKYEESMNTVLVQEVIRYNKLLTVVRATLRDLQKALKGLVVMSQELETMANSLYNNAVPQLWASKAYPSLKPLASWVTDLVSRMAFIQTWIDSGIPPAFWISGFFFPQAFLTGTLQNYARKAVISIDTISFDFLVMKQPVDELKERPENGCYIYGLYLEGARWDADTAVLAESKAKELYTEMPVIQLVPMANRKQPEDGMYVCPVYKTLTRAGTLSTTGHSTNYVIAVEVPSDKPQHHWIKRGVALLCALNY
jgi:dynein heavy chain